MVPLVYRVLLGVDAGHLPARMKLRASLDLYRAGGMHMASSRELGMRRVGKGLGKRLGVILKAAATTMLLVPMLILTGSLVTPAAANQVLILASTVSGGSTSSEAAEVTAKGFVPVLVDDATWGAMTTSQFASYKAIVIGDPTCSETIPAAAVANTSTWGAAVTGNTLIIGTDPVFHGKTQFVNQGIDFALA